MSEVIEKMKSHDSLDDSLIKRKGQEKIMQEQYAPWEKYTNRIMKFLLEELVKTEIKFLHDKGNQQLHLP